MSAPADGILHGTHDEWRAAQARMAELPSYYRWIFSLVRAHVGDRVLEVGCGIGNFTGLLAQNCSYVAAADVDAVARDSARRRLQERTNVEFFNFDLADGSGDVPRRPFDAIVCLDVIEHLSDDESALRRLTPYVARGGYLIVKVPACPWLYGEVDRASGHYRRYTRAGLITAALRAGWQTVRCQYMNVCGVGPYWYRSRVLSRRANYSRTFSRWQWRIVPYVIPALRVIDRVMGPPIGQSLVMVARLNVNESHPDRRATEGQHAP